MQLWLVTIAGDTELAVLAATPAAATRLVAEEMVRAAHFRVRAATPELTEAILNAKPRDRARLLQKHGNPAWAGDTKREERRVREYVALQARIREYVETLVATTAWLSPSQIRDVQRILWPAVTPFPGGRRSSAVVAHAQLISDDGRRTTPIETTTDPKPPC